MIICVYGSSGSGKTHLVELLKKNQNNLPFTIVKPVTDCSRLPRIGEVHGKDYYFRTAEEFEKRIQNNEYVEHSLYANTYRGLRIEELKKCLEIPNSLIVLVLDINGVNAIKKEFPQAKSVFIKVDKQTLEERMKLRGDDEENIKKRLEFYEIANEKENEKYADYIIENNDTSEVLLNSFLKILN